MLTNATTKGSLKKRALSGFGNLYKKESKAWWGTHRWWVNALLWTVILCGLTMILLFGQNYEAVEAAKEEIAAAGGLAAYTVQLSVDIFFQFGVSVSAIGTVILMLDQVIGEKQNGVAEWLLSKPVSRSAYILAKLAANMVPIILLMVWLPSALTYALVSLRLGAAFPILPFLSGVGIMALNTIFYLICTLMLGTFFNNRGPILGIALGSVLGGGLIGGFINQLQYIMPWVLPKTASLIATGQEVAPEFSLLPIVASAVWCFVFVLMALVTFDRSEF
jgi:ABC-2 type transport system permease protein